MHPAQVKRVLLVYGSSQDLAVHSAKDSCSPQHKTQDDLYWQQMTATAVSNSTARLLQRLQLALQLVLHE